MEKTNKLNDLQKELIKAYSEQNMHAVNAAKSLFIHRNTVYYQFNRIKEKTGLDPKDYHDLQKLIKEVNGIEICINKHTA